VTVITTPGQTKAGTVLDLNGEWCSSGPVIWRESQMVQLTAGHCENGGSGKVKNGTGAEIGTFDSASYLFQNPFFPDMDAGYVSLYSGFGSEYFLYRSTTGTQPNQYHFSIKGSAPLSSIPANSTLCLEGWTPGYGDANGRNESRCGAYQGAFENSGYVNAIACQGDSGGLVRDVNDQVVGVLKSLQDWQGIGTNFQGSNGQMCNHAYLFQSIDSILSNGWLCPHGCSVVASPTAAPVSALQLPTGNSTASKNHCLDGNWSSYLAPSPYAVTYEWPDCWPGDTQTWSMVPINDLHGDLYQLRRWANGSYCLDVYGGIPNNGTPVGQYPCALQSNQTWRLTQLMPGSDWYSMKSNVPGYNRCLDISGGGGGPWQPAGFSQTGGLRCGVAFESTRFARTTATEHFKEDRP